MQGIESVLAMARKAQSRAYAPYSEFRVGAVLETDDGTLFAGCNVENASLGLTVCAERGALVAAVAAGHSRFRRLILVTDGDDVVPPCGACRAVLSEFAPDLAVTSFSEGGRGEWTLTELLPLSFRLPKSGRSGNAGAEQGGGGGS